MTRPATRRWILWLPLAGFFILFALVALALFAPADRTVKSQLVGAPLPSFALQPIVSGKPGLASTDLAAGEPRLVNVFASWCVPCIAEAPHLLELQRKGAVIDAIAIRDTEADIRRFLDRHGDPFRAIGDDPHRQVQLALGSAGVPETFVVDGQGRVTHQHVGPILAADVPDLLAELEKAR